MPGQPCVFVTSTKVTPQVGFLLNITPAASVSGGGLCFCSIVAGQGFYPPDALLPPLRLHLMERVLLI